MKTKKFILLAIFAVFTFTNCKGEEICRSELPKGLISYELGQIVSFTDPSEKTFDVIVTENNTKWIQESIGAHKNDYTSSEMKTVILKSEANDLVIRLKITIPDCCLSCKDYTLFNIYINNMNFVLTTDKEGNFLNSISPISFHESFEINGKVYSDVVEVNREYNATQLFYNKTYGILQINSGGENFLTLNPEMEEGKSGMQRTVVVDDDETDSQPPANDGKENNNDDMLKSLELTAETIDTQSIDFVVYPNPTNGNFTVKVSGGVQPFTLEIFNDKGRLIQTIRGKNEIININKTKYVQGAYFVKISMGGKTAVRKIVVQ